MTKCLARITCASDQQDQFCKRRLMISAVAAKTTIQNNTAGTQGFFHFTDRLLSFIKEIKEL